MKFIEDGPNVPDELLIARDEGKVLFFCGAGVSFARAKLSDFLKLAGEVIDDLGSLQDSQARRLHDAANQPLKSGGRSYVPVDRMFTALDQEFESADVRNSVARALRPKTVPVDLTAHRILLDLSRGSDGRSRLITTNFDLLFEECEAGLRTWGPPHLPLPDHPGDFEGVIHLHGRTNPSYTGISGDEVVLSSSDFGKAYLSDGWATQYIRRLVSHFKIVFVGYSADDPPVQYLLEALRDDKATVSGIYAFQHGEEAQAREQWAQKGVAPIAFGRDYETLWQTLSAWAERARDPDGWHDLTLANAMVGPSKASPLFRSRIVHVLTSRAGTARLKRMAVPLPTTWLYALDPDVRYLQPMREDRSDPISATFDPFDSFGLDADIVPEPADLDDHFNDRKTPSDAWDGLATSPADLVGLMSTHAGGIVAQSHLVARPWALASWFIGRIQELPALWWAAGRKSLHSDVLRGLHHEVRYRLADDATGVRRYWRYLLDSLARGENANDDGYGLQEQVNRDGWSPALVRKAVAHFRTSITIRRQFATPPPLEADTDPSKFISLDVDYPEPHVEFKFDNASLPLAVGLWRDLLLEAEQLENEIGAYILLEPTRSDVDQPLDVTLNGLTGSVIRFIRLMKAWEVVDPDAAASEARIWSSLGGLVFERLRIWAAGRATLTAAQEAGEAILGLNDETFWSYRHERDLLLSIRDRWNDLSQVHRSSIETRLLTAPVPYLANHEDRDELTATHRLDAIQFLASRGVNFSFDLEAEKVRLQSVARRWKEEQAQEVGLPSVRGPYSITRDTDPSDIVEIPLGDLLPLKAQAEGIGERVDLDPFAGLSAQQPVRALRALHNAMRRNEPTGAYWSTFLRANQEVSTSPRFDSVVVALIARMPTQELPSFWYPLIEWFAKRAHALDQRGRGEFDAVWNAVLAAAELQQSGYRPRPQRDWSFESLNSIAGRLTLALLQMGLPQGQMGIPVRWLSRMEQVLRLPGDHRRHALFLIARQTGWLFQENPGWTATNVLNAAEIGHPDADAFWAGFAGLRHVPAPELLGKVKNAMLERVGIGGSDAKHLVSHLLGGWRMHGTDQIVSSAELRDVLVLGSNEVRRSALDHLGNWAAKDDAWKALILPFLSGVWPKQRTVRTPQMTAALFGLASRFPDIFSDVVAAVIGRLVRLVPGLSLRMDAANVEKLDQAALELLVGTLELLLPNERSEWPYDAKQLIETIDSDGRADGPRLQELKRRAAERDI